MSDSEEWEGALFERRKRPSWVDELPEEARREMRYLRDKERTTGVRYVRRRIQERLLSEYGVDVQVGNVQSFMDGKTL